MLLSWKPRFLSLHHCLDPEYHSQLCTFSSDCVRQALRVAQRDWEKHKEPHLQKKGLSLLHRSQRNLSAGPPTFK